jgi:hypothetical protein
MTLIVGMLGAGILFALFSFSATRQGTRLETEESCQGSVDADGSCSLQDECEGCGPSGKSDGWWPKNG